jgi:hypothetical protein
MNPPIRRSTVPTLEDLGNAMVKDMLQSNRGQFWFPWRPGYSQIKLGSFCRCNGLTATYEGDIGRFGCAAMQVPAGPGLSISGIGSHDYTILYTGLDHEGKAKITTELGDLDLDAKTSATFKYNRSLQYNVIVSDIQIYSLGQTDATAYLANTVWPQLRRNPRWKNAEWVICGNVATARSYVLTGAVASDSQFSIEMERGAGIADLVKGKITAAFNMRDAQRLDLQDSAFQGRELIVGYSLYHYDDDGTPRLYTPWY